MLLDLLDNLRQGSRATVQNGDNLDDFEKKLHVSRPVERDLFRLMQQVHQAGHGLIIVVGNSGDGKSHMFSTIKGNLNEHFDPTIVSEFKFYNDASESCSPNMDSMKTLKYALADFSLRGNAERDGIKMVMAMNLGKAQEFVNNKEFQDADKGLFPNIISALQETIPMLGTPLSRDEIVEHNNIHVLDFSGYQMFELVPESINLSPDNVISVPFLSSFIDGILLKIGKADRYENDFYKAYFSERMNKKPYVKNFFFLTDQTIRKTIAQLIVEAIVRYRLVVSPRELMVFIYSIVVGDDNKSKTCKLPNLLPSLIFDGGENRIVNSLSHLDPLKSSDRLINSWLGEYMTCDSVPENLATMGESILRNSGIEEILNQMFQNGGQDMIEAVRFLVRYRYLLEYRPLDQAYVRFSNLMTQCKCRSLPKEVNHVFLGFYSLAEKAILLSHSIHNDSSELHVPLAFQSENYKFISDVNLKRDLNKSKDYASFDPNYSSCFEPYVTLFWVLNDDEEIRLEVDFQMYQYLTDLSEGRLFNGADYAKNLFFNNFVNRLSEASKADHFVKVILGNETVLIIDETQGYLDVR